ncbi:hypothetical protein MPSEU_000997300 [Mayamaea pseudoterrestris]|nr:hypothetical protein MPSEU_000997300 [Mayamaea pseudoterrestris]
MNQFVQRVANYIANEIIIKGLSNSKTFQTFAIRSDSKIQEFHKTGTESFNKAFEELSKMQAVGSTSAMNNNVGTAARSGPPVPPTRGFAGFMEAFLKEIRKDLGVKS